MRYSSLRAIKITPTSWSPIDWREPCRSFARPQLLSHSSVCREAKSELPRIALSKTLPMLLAKSAVSTVDLRRFCRRIIIDNWEKISVYHTSPNVAISISIPPSLVDILLKSDSNVDCIPWAKIVNIELASAFERVRSSNICFWKESTATANSLCCERWRFSRSTAFSNASLTLELVATNELNVLIKSSNLN